MVEEEKILLKGTHGTCRSVADNIKRTGFFGGVGRHGRGVYLWATSSDDDACHKWPVFLARCYAEGKKRDFANENDDTPKVLLCNIITNIENFVDIESDQTNRLFKAYIEKQQKFLNDSSKGTAKQRACKVADGFIALLENVKKVTLDVVHTKTVIPPAARNEMPIAQKYLGGELYGCYVVRNAKCIPKQTISTVG